MLTIKRVPTVLSNYQEDVCNNDQSVGCGRNCLGNCCLPVSKLHLYEFKKDEDVSVENSTVTFCVEGSPLSF
ncbi:hypothetical protein RJ639_043357 [Escallonia herrerae]|uniref:Uncharacterized protein n=1 Tax=Escallonia herrerae TaxID=1293975 RepID=A0AA88WCW4_9ASTE|nr:hypothetical protein RJ639_043357 [Escallonia herrerae]